MVSGCCRDGVIHRGGGSGGVRAPASLLLDTRLTPSAKLIWVALRLARDGAATRPVLLEERTGLSRKTVLKGLVELADAGWRPAPPGGAGNTEPASAGAGALIPSGLAEDRRIGARGRILYGQLQLTRGYRHPAGAFTYACLSGLTGTSLRPVKRAVRDLVETGWLQVAQEHQLAPVRFSLCNPEIDRGRAEVEHVRRLLDEAPYLGEALMRAYLSLLVDSEDFQDDAAPGFLVNPLTQERMQLDRFYPPGVAFEFNGPQHYGATDRFSGESAARQRGRDYMKMGICAHRGIRLVVIHPEDLSLDGMRRLIGPLLPLRDLTGHEPLIAYLDSVSRRYRLAAKRGRRSARTDCGG